MIREKDKMLSLRFTCGPAGDVSLIFSNPPDHGDLESTPSALLFPLLDSLEKFDWMDVRLSHHVKNLVDRITSNGHADEEEFEGFSVEKFLVKSEPNEGGSDASSFVKTEMLPDYLDLDENGELSDDYVKDEDSDYEIEEKPKKKKAVNGVSLKKGRQKLKKEEVINGDGKYACDVCDFSSKSLTGLHNHREKKHGSLSTKYPCDRCDFATSSMVKLNLHLKSEHPDAFCANCNKVLSCNETHICEQSDLSFSCGECEQMFDKEFKLKYHVKRFHQGYREVCEDCGAEVSGKSSLKRHKMSVHGNMERKFKCTLCPASFKMDATLKKHVERHGATPSCPCPHCGKVFLKQSEASLHIRRVHLKNFTYFCDLCGKGFLFESELSKHVNGEHKGARDHICSICGADFKTPIGLQHHHLGKHADRDVWLKCNYCEKTFPRKNQLDRHTLINHEKDNWNFLCKICNEKFFSVNRLREHVRTHTGNRPYSCNVCKETFPQSYNGRHHIKKHHGGDFSHLNYDKSIDVPDSHHCMIEYT